MPCSNNHNNLYRNIGKLVTMTAFFISSFVIACAFSNNEERITQDRLRQSYDGLDPRDYK